ncbi:hypothetical protein [Comamonas thiooxydans]|uniref:hypothetical protein n=1 Tax=Comamonas thiooxydans TaxID=363952 RepID=UPI000B410E66|nr:hypothetical protein [Comamonas thiooxydans]
MIRFISIHNDACRGTHTHICWTSHQRTLKKACEEILARVAKGAVARAPVFYDFGPGDSNRRRLDALPDWPKVLKA